MTLSTCVDAFRVDLEVIETSASSLPRKTATLAFKPLRGDDRLRSRCLRSAKPVLFQLSYIPIQAL